VPECPDHDLPHFSYQIGIFNEFGERIASGENDMQQRRLMRLQPGAHLAKVEPAIAEAIRDLVKHDHIVLTTHDLFLRQFPPMPRLCAAFIQIFAEPCEAVATAQDFDAHLLSGFMLAKAGILVFDELNNAHLHIATPGAHHNAERGSRFAFTVAGIDDDQPFFDRFMFGSDRLNGRLFVSLIGHIHLIITLAARVPVRS